MLLAEGLQKLLPGVFVLSILKLVDAFHEHDPLMLGHRGGHGAHLLLEILHLLLLDGLLHLSFGELVLGKVELHFVLQRYQFFHTLLQALALVEDKENKHQDDRSQSYPKETVAVGCAVELYLFLLSVIDFL